MDQPVPIVWLGNYLTVDDLHQRDVVTITFPMVEETFTRMVGLPAKGRQSGYYDGATYPEPEEYTLHFKGNTLVDISPRDEDHPYPIYQREKYRTEKTPMKRVARYVAPYTIRWHGDDRGSLRSAQPE